MAYRRFFAGKKTKAFRKSALVKQLRHGIGFGTVA
jgi:hypothetical protein